MLATVREEITGATPSRRTSGMQLLRQRRTHHQRLVQWLDANGLMMYEPNPLKVMIVSRAVFATVMRCLSVLRPTLSNVLKLQLHKERPWRQYDDSCLTTSTSWTPAFLHSVNPDDVGRTYRCASQISEALKGALAHHPSAMVDTTTAVLGSSLDG